MKLRGGEECQGCHLVIKQGKISIKRKTLLVWFGGGSSVCFFSYRLSKSHKCGFCSCFVGVWGFFDAWKKNKYNIFQRAVLNIHCSGLVRLLSNLCMVIGFMLPYSRPHVERRVTSIERHLGGILNVSLLPKSRSASRLSNAV